MSSGVGGRPQLYVSRDEVYPIINVAFGNESLITVPEPVRLCALGAKPLRAPYRSVHEADGLWRADVELSSDDGTRVAVSDRWKAVDESTVRIDRTATIVAAGPVEGVRVEFHVNTSAGDANPETQWEYFIPGALYKRNDTDHDGVEDYLGSLTQDHRDDRLASLAVLAFDPRAQRYVALTRISAPVADTRIDPSDLARRHFVQDTDIGSLGIAPGKDHVCLRASYPFAEERSFCLNTDGEGWAAYLPNEQGRTLRVSYGVFVGDAASLTDAVWEVITRQIRVLGTAPQASGFTLDAALEQRNLLTQQYFRSWRETEDPREPAGYLVHFSPRSGWTLGALLEYGFSGAQTLLAYVSIEHAYRRGVPLWAERARRVIEFFITHCQLPNGFSHGIYDTTRQDFVYWFTGILTPFNYARDEQEIERYLGPQVTRALLPIARELRTIAGNYTRTMCESIYPVLLAYQAESARGVEYPAWLNAGRRFGGFLLAAQGADGSWHRAYRTDGTPLISPAAWFGATPTERKSGTIFPIEVLVTLHELTGDERYLAAAERAGDFIIRTYVDPVEYVGGLNDTTHIKSVKTDSVGVMFVMRSLIKLYGCTGNRWYLEAAIRAAKILASWVYLWNVPMPTGTILGDAGFNSAGWAVCDVLPGGSYLDNELLEFTGDLIEVAVQSAEETFFDIAEIVEMGMHQGLSMPGNMYGYVAPGIQCEGVMTAYWLSDPQTTEFSGAAAKHKGDDNDTCNGLTNGQAAYALFEIEERYGTMDFAALREQLFRSAHGRKGTSP